MTYHSSDESLNLEEITIKKKDIENFGKKVMKEVYEFLHDKSTLSFEEMKVEKDKLEKYLVHFYFEFIYNKNFLLLDIFNYEKLLKNTTEDKIKYEEYLKEIKSKIEDESLDIDLIFNVLDKIKLDMNMDIEIYIRKKAFIYNYLVFDLYHKHLTK